MVRGHVFTIRGFCVLLTLRNKKAMEQSKWDKIVFLETLSDCRLAQYADHVVHVLCMKGCMSFTFQEVRYNVVPGDYVILPNPSLASEFSESDDFDAIIMCPSEPFITSMSIRSNYGIIGHMALLMNPIMKLSAHDCKICTEDLSRIRERLAEDKHLFREEMMGYLLLAHILNLYDIHARSRLERNASERNAELLRRFVELLYHKEYVKSRSLPHYASQLCITPHYLTEVCKKVSGKPATYWIDRFTTYEIARLLRRKEIPLKDIAMQLNFSSLSHLSRYVQRQMGMPPSEYRNRVVDTPLAASRR